MHIHFYYCFLVSVFFSIQFTAKDNHGWTQTWKRSSTEVRRGQHKIYQRGWLEKKGAKRKNWTKRYFVLKDNYLFYCKKEKVPPQGIINLHGCTVVKTEGPTAKLFSFSLMAPKSVSVDAKWTNRTYSIAASTNEELSTWIQALQDASNKAAAKAAKNKESPAPKDIEAETRVEKQAPDSEDDSDGEDEPEK